MTKKFGRTSRTSRPSPAAAPLTADCGAVAAGSPRAAVTVVGTREAASEAVTRMAPRLRANARFIGAILADLQERTALNKLVLRACRGDIFVPKLKSPS